MKVDYRPEILRDLLRLRRQVLDLETKIEEKARDWRRCTQGLADCIRFPVVCKVDGLHWAVEADGTAKPLTHFVIPEEPR